MVTDSRNVPADRRERGTTGSRSPPRSAWISGGLVSCALAVGVLVVFLQSGPSRPVTRLVPPAACATAAFVFAWRWPLKSWRWGALLSAGFCLFFLLVFAAFLSLGRAEGSSLLRALSVLLAGLAASLIAGALRQDRAAHSR